MATYTYVFDQLPSICMYVCMYTYIRKYTYIHIHLRYRPVTGIFVLLKQCPRIKIFRKFLSHGIKSFVLEQNISENFCPWTKVFRKFLSHPNKICPTPKFLEKDEIRAKASLASQTTLSSFSMAIGKGRKSG